MLCLLYSFSLSITLILGSYHCLDEDDMSKVFYKIRSCYRSTGAIVAHADLHNLTDCLNFAKQRKGLAVNYSPPEASRRSGELFKRCQVLACPEIGNMSTLVKDSSYDYYSLYGNLNASGNATCIKSTGIFRLLHEKLNYTDAAATCQNLGGDLAHVVSEIRTNSLSTLINFEVSDWYKAAYVGLDDMRLEGLFETPSGSPLNCFMFRAWNPGHPRKKHKHNDCVILDNERTWRVINCKNKLPFICEIYPQKPEDTTEENYAGVNCTNITDKVKKLDCVEEKELMELLRNSSRTQQCSLFYDLYG